MDYIQRSWRHRLLTMLGWQFVEPQTLFIVFRDEQFHRFLEPGYHFPISTWRERIGIEPISTRFRFTQTGNILVTTADRIQAKLNVKILFRFDPRACPAEIIARAALFSDSFSTGQKGREI